MSASSHGNANVRAVTGVSSEDLKKNPNLGLLFTGGAINLATSKYKEGDERFWNSYLMSGLNTQRPEYHWHNDEAVA